MRCDLSTTAWAAGRVLAASALAGSVLCLGACGGSSSGPDGSSTSGAPSAEAILPTDTDPIDNTSSVQALQIDGVLVENNVDEAGKAAPDHLEIALTNTGRQELKTFEVYYTITDPTTGDSESYYSALPASFSIPPGGHRTVHFDNTGAVDHFAVNDFSLYYTDKNALEVTVEVSAIDAASQTVTVNKDAGGAEEAD
jgi:hypothetical protein